MKTKLMTLASIALSACQTLTPYPSKDLPLSPTTKGEIQDISTVFDMSWQDAIKTVRTPQEAQQYCNLLQIKRMLRMDNGTHMYSFKQAHEGSPVDCTEGAFAAAALLSDDGYPPLTISLVDDGIFNRSAHILYVYRQESGYGTVGINTFDYLPPVYPDLDSLARELARVRFQESGLPTTAYGIQDLSDMDYISSEEDLERNCTWPYPLE